MYVAPSKNLNEQYDYCPRVKKEKFILSTNLNNPKEPENSTTIYELPTLLCQNMIKNCPVTAEDAKIVEKSFGPDMGELQGKTTRKTPNPVWDDTIEIPPEIREIHKDTLLCFDILYVSGMPFMNGIDAYIKHWLTKPLSNIHSDKLYQGLDSYLSIYNFAGHTVTEIQCDQQFATIINTAKDYLGVHMNWTADG